MKPPYSFDPKKIALEIMPILVKHKVRVNGLPAIYEELLREAERSTISMDAMEDQENSLQKQTQPEK